MSIRTRFLERAAIAIAVTLASSTASAEEPQERKIEPPDQTREHFKEGMEDYANGRYRDAIAKWEPIYRELDARSPGQPYRLAFNLARAYEKLGGITNTSRAAEYYVVYLGEYDRRRANEGVVDAALDKQAEDARARIDELNRTYGRFTFGAGPRAVRVDSEEPRAAARHFTVYVSPGAHRIAFDPALPSGDRVESIAAGQEIAIDVPPLPSAVPVPEDRYETRVHRPFSSTILYVAGGVTLASFAAPILFYADARATKSDYDKAASGDPERKALKDDYESTRTNAYLSYAVTGACLLATGVLVSFYFLASSETRVRIAPSVTATSGALGLDGRF